MNLTSFIETAIMDNKNNNPGNSSKDQQQEVFNRPGSNDHNDYRIKGDEQKHKDEKESYMDYNGNSEANDPGKAREEK
jgi:hypothetical protein